MNKKIVNAETGEETIVPLTSEEILAIEKQDAEYRTKIEQAKATKAALLEKLGITEEEAKLLLS